MSAASGAAAAKPRPAIWTAGFRPFFLATALWAICAVALWLALLTTGLTLPSRFDPLTWHIHEMLFGFVMAAVGGFLLTAIPNWTKRPPVGGAPLVLLAGFWLLGRIVCLTSGLMPAWLSIAADLAFPVTLLVVAAREIVAGRNWRNLPMVLPAALLGAANLLMHLEANGVAVSPGLGWRLGLATTIVLISVIAGRIVPTFTRNWLTKRGVADLPPTNGWIDRGALGLLHVGLIGWVVLPEFAPVGALLLFAAALNCARLHRWRGRATMAEPLLFILHLGYAWMVAGSALLGLSMLGWGVPQTAALHALTVGAFGTMILAVMTRATLGHTGRTLTANRATAAIYVSIAFAALLRLVAAFGLGPFMPILVASGCLWIVAFSLFARAYGPMLLSDRTVPAPAKRSTGLRSSPPQ
ncbi:MAG TPA: NnrS family protein [Aliidongia sp.]|uniref:NnrS family protein n=1 Tax=Aliidongia sp. TaxID=1914230 RepID=UPI002DDCE028|nr:NnrS family protein [Aliidongia sp.]HEV2677148.1 NnrS family protein [Aliidongia sp.]